MPQLVRLYILSAVWGFVLALVFTTLLIALDVAHLRHLVAATQGGWIAVLLLVVFHTILFAGVQFGIGVMRLAERVDSPPGGLRAPLVRQSAPVPVSAAAKAPRRKGHTV